MSPDPSKPTDTWLREKDQEWADLRLIVTKLVERDHTKRPSADEIFTIALKSTHDFEQASQINKKCNEFVRSLQHADEEYAQLTYKLNEVRRNRIRLEEQVRSQQNLLLFGVHCSKCGCCHD